MEKIFILAMFVILSSGLAFAAGSVSSVDTSLSASSATTGTSVILTATSTASSADVSNVQIQLIKDSGPGDFSVSDPSGGSYTTTVTTSGTAKTFTFTAGSAGTYTYKVTDTWSGGSKSSTTETMSFVAPSSLSVSGSDSAVTLTQGQSTSLTVNIQNSQSSNILTSYSLTYASSNISMTGDPTSSTGTTVSAGTTKSLAWTITHSSCFTGTKNVVFALGDNTNAFTLAVTGNTSCGSTTTSSSSSSSGGGGSSNVTTSGTTQSKLFSTSANIATTLVFDKVSNGFTEIQLTTSTDKSSIKLTVTDSTKPSSAPNPPGVAYSYTEVTKSDFTNSDISAAKVRFKVPASWITSNDVNPETISLYRYTDAWEKLVTIQTGSASDYYYYEADTSGFSTFAIAGEKNPSSETSGTGGTAGQTNETDQTNQTGTTETSIPSVPVGSSDANYLVGLIVIVLAVLFFAIHHYMLKMKKPKYGYARKS